jgi:hypothetical protein
MATCLISHKLQRLHYTTTQQKPNQQTFKMATIRRLSDDDVRAVFEAVHDNRQPPRHLQFQIVPVGPEGLKLSPPSFEFEGEQHMKVLAMATFELNFKRQHSHTLVSSLVLLSNNRWTLHLAQAAEEEEESPGSSESHQGAFELDDVRYAKHSSSQLSLEFEWSSVPSTDCHPATILLPQGRCRLQQQEGWRLVDHGTFRIRACAIMTTVTVVIICVYWFSHSSLSFIFYSMEPMERRIWNTVSFTSTSLPSVPSTRESRSTLPACFHLLLPSAPNE